MQNQSVRRAHDIFFVGADTMRPPIFDVLIALVVHVHGFRLPFIQDVFLSPDRAIDANKTEIFNGTCDECMCKAFSNGTMANSVALNCFANQTCQLFPTFPVLYNLRTSVGAQVYFLQGTFPYVCQGCMPNITELIDRLKNATPVVVPLSFGPGTFGYDETDPSKAVVIGLYSGELYWFSPKNMTSLRNQTSDFRETIALRNHSIFPGKDDYPTLHILDKQTLAPLANITYPSFWQIRKLIFLNNSQTIVLPTQYNHSITFVNVQSPTQYTVQVRMLPVLRCVSSILFPLTLPGRTPFPTIESARCGEGQRHVLLRLVMG